MFGAALFGSFRHDGQERAIKRVAKFQRQEIFMSDKPRTDYSFSKLGQQFCGLTRLRRRIIICVAALALLATGSAIADIYLPNLFPFLDLTGFSATNSTTGSLDLSGPFFQSLGTNERSCGTCHAPGDGFGLSAADAQLRFAITRGKDPLFDQVDGSTCPSGPINNSLLVNNGLIRIGIQVPPNLTHPSAAQFTVAAVQDPYGCALTTDSQGEQTASMYRRPLPATNLGFLSAVMFDGRESFFYPLNNEASFAANLNSDLTQQAIDATLGHAQAMQPPTATQLSQIVGFEMALNSAQTYDFFAGNLYGQKGSQGGPQFLPTQQYYPSMNDSLGGDPEGNPFNPNAFTIYSSWQNSGNSQQASISRGEQIFNNQPLTVSDVPGLTTGTQQIMGTCTTCHDTPNVGNHSFPLPLDIGTGHSLQYETDPNIIAGLQQLRQPLLPVFELVCTEGSETGQTFYTTDPGRALISGQCSDISRIKGPILRGLAARAPYFHNGAAANLSQVVNFYNKRFEIGLTSQQMQDLINFLQTL
jgi:cytochrome c peroxidase